ncbi:MAG: hypothetical protein WD468_03290, partial [Pirellulales bacterium]
NPDVVARLFHTIQSLAPDLRRRNDCQVLIRQIRIIGGEIGRISNKSDRDRVTEQQQQALHALAESQPLDN